MRTHLPATFAPHPRPFHLTPYLENCNPPCGPWSVHHSALRPRSQHRQFCNVYLLLERAHTVPRYHLNEWCRRPWQPSQKAAALLRLHWCSGNHALYRNCPKCILAGRSTRNRCEYLLRRILCASKLLPTLVGSSPSISSL